jgi:hypothetical protein
MGLRVLGTTLRLAKSTLSKSTESNSRTEPQKTVCALRPSRRGWHRLPPAARVRIDSSGNRATTNQCATARPGSQARSALRRRGTFKTGFVTCQSRHRHQHGRDLSSAAAWRRQRLQVDGGWNTAPSAPRGSRFNVSSGVDGRIMGPR